MASVSADFPEPFSELLVRLQGALESLRQAAALTRADGPSLVEADSASTPFELDSVEASSAAAFDGVEVALRECGQALRASGRAPLALVVEACAASLTTLQCSHPRHAPENDQVIERALLSVLHNADQLVGDDLALVAELFPSYQAVVQLSGPDRAHPADLWPSRHPLVELPSDPFATPRRPDADARLALEESLLKTLRQPSPPAFRAISDLCAALGEGAAVPQSGLWKLASAAYEAQADELLAPDVYLKRIGPRLLTLARTSLEAVPDVVALQIGAHEAAAAGRSANDGPARAQAQASARQLGHELLFRCHSALAAAGVAGAPAVGPRLERMAVACGVPVPRPLTALQPVAQPQTSNDSRAALEPGPVAGWASPAAPWGETNLPPLAAGQGSDAGFSLPGDEAGSQAEAPLPDLVLPTEPAPELNAPDRSARSLAEAVPGLPSSADLDLSGWGLAANADKVVTPDDETKVIGALRLEIPVFNAFLNDADEASRRLSMLLAEWAVAPVLPVPSEAAVQAFALAQGADRVGHEALAALARQMVGVLRACAAVPGPAAVAAEPAWAAQNLTSAAEEMRRVLHQFAAGFLTEPSAACVQGLEDCLADPEPSTASTPGDRGSQPLAGAGELQSLHDLVGLQMELASALDRLAKVRPSQAAAASDLEGADQHFDHAWSEATNRLAAAEGLIRSLLNRSGDAQR